MKDSKNKKQERGLPYPNLESEDFARAIQKARGRYRNREFSACVRECSVMLENGLRVLLGELFAFRCSVNEQETLFGCAKEIGKCQKTFRDFSLGELIRFFRNEQVASIFANHHKPWNKRRIGGIDWKVVLESRNKAVHHTDEIPSEDAFDVIYYVRRFFIDTSLVSSEKAKNISLIGLPGGNEWGRCDGCGRKVDGHWHYCPHCGHMVNARCPNCGIEVSNEWKICPECDAPLFEGGPEAARETFRMLCRGAWIDLFLNTQERKMLEQERLKLGIGKKDADRIVQSEAPKGVTEYTLAVEAVLIDGKIDGDERSFLDRKADELGIPRDAAERIERCVADERCSGEASG